MYYVIIKGLLVNKVEYVKLVQRLNEYSEAYHKNHTSIISDEQYDQLYRSLTDAEVAHPNWVMKDSPSQRVGEAPVDDFAKIKHYTRMYGLDNAFDQKDLETYWKRFNEYRGKLGFDVVDNYYLNYKMDGLSCELWYNDGKLTTAVTRGDGTEGEDVTANVRTISNVPDRIRLSEPIVIRGEVVVHHNDFDHVNYERKIDNLPPFANCRNYAAGSLRQKSPEVTRDRCLKFYAWDASLLVKPKRPLTHCEIMGNLGMLGFSLPPSKLCHSVPEMIEFINETSRVRRALSYDIDGIVIKQNNPALYPKLGYNQHSPMFSIAFKFKATDSATTVKSITWQMGRTGKLTPVVNIEPVSINGATITKVTGNNASYIENKKLGPGAHISVIRSGDVIPMIKTITDTGDYTGLPDVCPCCGKPLLRKSVDIICTNPECKDKLTEVLIYMTSKDILNINGIGDKFIKTAISKNIITKFTDIFTPLESTDKAVSQGLLDVLVARARNIGLSELIVSLSIPMIGPVINNRIVPEVKTLEGFKNFIYDDKLMNILQISNNVKCNLRNWYSDEYNKKLLDELIALRLPNCI
jgi:DNA ligase (NAD+)